MESGYIIQMHHQALPSSSLTLLLWNLCGIILKTFATQHQTNLSYTKN